jgi:hypothetical protein
MLGLSHDTSLFSKLSVKDNKETLAKLMLLMGARVHVDSNSLSVVDRGAHSKPPNTNPGEDDE